MIAQPALQPGNQIFRITAKLKAVIAQDQLIFGIKARRPLPLNFDRAWLLGNQGFSKYDAATTEQKLHVFRNFQKQIRIAGQEVRIVLRAMRQIEGGDGETQRVPGAARPKRPEQP